MFADSTSVFRDRAEAGRKLGARLSKYRGTDSIVVALPRGGVVVGYEVAKTLGLPLEVYVVRKIGHPESPELGVGAIAEDGSTRLDTKVLQTLGLGVADLRPIIRREQQECARRAQLYRSGKPFPNVSGRTVILVDDGIATGNTIRAAVAALRTRRPGRVVLAVAVSPPETLHDLRWTVDEIVCLTAPADFAAVGQVYQSFEQVEDSTVLELLHRNHTATSPQVAHG